MKSNKEYDVVVCGGGSAGCAAAIKAARCGADTILIETGGALGGALTQGCVGFMMDLHGKPGILNELIALVSPNPDTCEDFMFDVEKMKWQLEKLCIESGVTLRYHTFVCGVEADKHVNSVIAQSKSGTEVFRGKIFIDCTGDGDVGFLAGCDYQEGNNGQLTQPMSFNCLLSGLKYEEVKRFLFNAPGCDCENAKHRLFEEFQRAGFSTSYAMPTLGYYGRGCYAMMINHIYNLCGTDAEDLTIATIQGRAEVHNAVEALRSLGGCWKDIVITQTASSIGVREGRRIEGLTTVTLNDIIKGEHYNDSVCHVGFNVDIHTPDGYTTNNVHVKPYDIPMRALISRKYENLMMAGRCISGDFYAHASYRVTGNTVRMGEAAGAAAAYAASHGIIPADVPICVWQE